MTRRIQETPTLTEEAIDKIFEEARLDQASFIDLVFRATVLEEHEALEQLSLFLERLREYLYEQADEDVLDLIGRPSIIELLYDVRLERIDEITGRKLARRNQAAAATLHNQMMPVALRYQALVFLLSQEELPGLSDDAATQDLLYELRNNCFHLEAFELFLAAMKDPALDLSHRKQARGKAARMFKEADPSIHFGFDPDAHLGRFETQSPEHVFEDWFQATYGRGVYFELVTTTSGDPLWRP